MAAGVGQLIQNTDYNSIRSLVDSVMGRNTNGYGQILASSDATVGSVISATSWLNLRTDLVKARQHQIGSAVGTSAAVDGRNLLVPSSGTLITEALRAQFASMAATVVSSRYDVDTDNAGGQLSLETLITGTRATAWNGVLTHTVTITGATSGDGSAANLRYFFNAGGALRISASITTGTSKNNAWNTMFTQMGTFVMGRLSTTYTGSSATSYNVGFENLTTSNQLMGEKLAPAGAYAENRYFIFARKSADNSQIVFQIEFRDNDAGDPYFDEAVQPTLTSTVSQPRPSGANVSVATPTASQSGL